MSVDLDGILCDMVSLCEDLIGWSMEKWTEEQRAKLKLSCQMILVAIAKEVDEDADIPSAF